MSTRLKLIVLLGLVPLLGQCSDDAVPGENEPWEHRLYTATHITKLVGTYFIVDTWHHRILYSHFPYDDLTQWNTLTDNIGGPHSIATDGDIVVYDDTGYGNLRAARYFNLDHFGVEIEGNADEYEMVYDVGMRPHRVIFDEGTDSFYAISSGSQEIIRLTNERGRLVIRHREELTLLNRAYTRSMSIIDGRMFFVTRGHGIIETTYRDDVYEVVQTFLMPTALDDLNDLFKSEAGWFYVTASPGAIVRARSIEDISAGRYEDLAESLGTEGTPYYLSEVDGRIFVPQITEHSGIISFSDSDPGPIADIDILYDFGPPVPADEYRKGLYPR